MDIMDICVIKYVVYVKMDRYVINIMEFVLMVVLLIFSYYNVKVIVIIEFFFFDCFVDIFIYVFC